MSNACDFPLCKYNADKGSDYCLHHRKHFGLAAQKKKEPIAHQSAKKKQQLKDEKPDRDEKEAWFKMVRQKLTGTCQCGCASPSSKYDDLHFRSSCCHIFPKAIFKSVQYHRLNFVERAFWGGCHTNLDNKSLDKWPGMADWDSIRQIFFVLEKLLTPEEKATKFYCHLKRLVEAAVLQYGAKHKYKNVDNFL